HEIDLDRMLEILAARRRLRLRTAETAEHLVDEIGEGAVFVGLPSTPAAARSLEAEAFGRRLAATEGEAVAARSPALVLRGAIGVEAGLEAFETELVVELPLGGVGEHVLRDRDL